MNAPAFAEGDRVARLCLEFHRPRIDRAVVVRVDGAEAGRPGRILVLVDDGPLVGPNCREWWPAAECWDLP